MIPLEQIRAARARGAGIVKITPLDPSATLTSLCGREIYLKLENLQKTGSFKVRGALNKIQLLDPTTRARGVVTASAGNHAQGVAYAARTVGVPVTVVMPESAPFSKVNATEGYGAHVRLAGRDYGEAYEHARKLVQEQGGTFIHAFDDAEIIAGQGTLGLELLEQLPDVDTVVVPVGGGGLLAGIASALRGSGCPARLIVVQPSGAGALTASLRAGAPVMLGAVETIADGLATRTVGQLPFAILRDVVSAVVAVSDAEIAAAVLLLLERAKTVVEGAGAVGVAAALAGRLPVDARKVAIVISGGNIDITLLDRIINLGLVQEGRLFRVSTRVADRPGELQRLTTCIAACRANIHQVRHERARPDLPLTETAIILELETRGFAHVEQVCQALQAAGFVIGREGVAPGLRAH